ncbi:GtrA family protein [Streptoalloteichus hindustanus]|uniref:Putative flippase GtrA (Transmembrane translocase of bactoprenol-linked glucose) n=1 Tax=Streptoalloteichus hindustanus TaxID=2017 RepID=A0A1M4VJ93_STRHI|nr:GtrA family protein [Streptoalloteichus hindustanus]SHE68907.1 Putative flippase GtrA (transmembrane translocase of bactoprenol-linked glucose) [Streptoalloteichus hindustanus]
MSRPAGAGADRLARMLRFGAVGVVNTGVYYGLYLLTRLAIPYLAAHVLAFLLAMVGSYFLNCYFTFRTRPTLRKFLLFPLSNLTNFVVQTTGLYLLVDVLGTNERIAPLIAAAAAIPITFLVAQFVLADRGADKPADHAVDRVVDSSVDPAVDRATARPAAGPVPSPVRAAAQEPVSGPARPRLPEGEVEKSP